MWLLIDNYDSFTYILTDYLRQLYKRVIVIRNDEYSLSQIIAMQPERIIISPGPRSPQHTPLIMEVIAHFHSKIPILGICLGHQALGLFFGAKVIKAPLPRHGKISLITHTQNHIFEQITSPLKVMRYHSLIIEHTEGTGLVPLAFTEDKLIMAFKHERFPCSGIQFHPESVLTECGLEILHNWAKTSTKYYTFP